MDLIQKISGMFTEVSGWLNAIAVVASAVAFSIGGFQHMFGGNEGLRKAKPWYIGAAVGLVIILGSSSIADFLKMKFSF